MTVWFTSDLHFCHNNIVRLCNRPFIGADDMNEALIANFNALVKPDDTLYILGDVNFKGRADDLVRRLNGRRILVEGNHDCGYDTNLFDEVYVLHEVKIPVGGRTYRFVLCHYPLAEWNGFYKGAIHLHGHQHNKAEYNQQMKEQKLLRYDVGVDANDFFPVSAEQVIDFFEVDK